jgi:hypothetical protein
MNKKYICVTGDEISIVTGEDDIHDDGYDFCEGSAIQEFDHESAAQAYSESLDDGTGVDFDGSDIYVKCVETGVVKKFHVSVSCDPTYYASEIELGGKQND